MIAGNFQAGSTWPAGILLQQDKGFLDGLWPSSWRNV